MGKNCFPPHYADVPTYPQVDVLFAALAKLDQYYSTMVKTFTGFSPNKGTLTASAPGLREMWRGSSATDANAPFSRFTNAWLFHTPTKFAAAVHDTLFERPNKPGKTIPFISSAYTLDLMRVHDLDPAVVKIVIFDAYWKALVDGQIPAKTAEELHRLLLGDDEPFLNAGATCSKITECELDYEKICTVMGSVIENCLLDTL